MQADLIKSSDNRATHLPVFAYGSLMADHVFDSVMISGLGNNYQRPRKTTGAILSGYQRFGVADQPYPAVVPATPNNTVQGVLWYIQSNSEIQLLDHFETDLYQRQVVSVNSMGESDTVQAYVYIWNRELSLLTGKEWNYEQFLAKEMKEWIKTQNGADGQPLTTQG
ncbi:hypothetical protein BATDEDRAFT_28028 [Batrachochytrium dendrobatidis JAM81]|uniref:Putative gamma-glutamylcyclotransferase n=1 Tax=Batrachochytrium dendrobatidis (strain JAM81 / FGSC 10211) TaxID=684364 RepID=F4PCL8_BATDJ|nr:uncharacterized protein BATDEDRAFT_28028 [Batrachochytrium dendrobatidis JAM81]EGF76968.1 hypothetical protein BATDEDRAFT_28028 [Batrachochytrium dendrobatidis JAM81]|eukprot:XP_006682388.1 hypothetical protein BATDEDRAFT_28028 [Batrachochytrium dendrobatidis JAM81]